MARTRTADMVALESDTENVEVGRIDVTAYLREDSQAVAQACGAVAVCGAN